MGGAYTLRARPVFKHPAAGDAGPDGGCRPSGHAGQTTTPLRQRRSAPSRMTRDIETCHSRRLCNLAFLAMLAYHGGMSGEIVELSVTEARNGFSDAINRAAYGGEVTYVTRGRGHQRAAAIVPAALVEQYEALLDERDAQIASARLAEIDAGRTTPVPAAQVRRELEV